MGQRQTLSRNHAVDHRGAGILPAAFPVIFSIIAPQPLV
jgi:hypothetical protein